ncbi:MAG: TIGR00153 family protein [Spirochaetes bacterium GWB1_48_6]|nr:MAG: TIGR00153 family protein [Spirochaetes bacterium GWB1_48_6]
MNCYYRPMAGIADLFPRSPLKGMIEHIDMVGQCVDTLETLFTALKAGKQAEVESLAITIQEKEEAADQLKKDLRKSVQKPLFLPVDKAELLSLLSAQDNIADVAQDIAQLFCLRKMTIPQDLMGEFIELEAAILNAARKAVETIRSLANLFEVGFKGPETEKVALILSQLEASEDDADKWGLSFTKHILAKEGEESPVSIMMWMRIIKVMGDLGNQSYKLAGRFKALVD